MSKTSNTVKIFDAFAREYEEKYMNVDSYSHCLDLFCKLLPANNAKVLELACGPGNITRYLLQIQPELQILATDLSGNMLKLAAKNNPLATTGNLDCKALKTLQSQFDGIVCGFGLPYLSKEEAIQFIKDSAEALNHKGVLYISTMEDDYNKSGYTGSSTNPDKKELYTHYHEASYLVKAIEINGFNNIIVDRIQQNETTTDLILIAQK